MSVTQLMPQSHPTTAPYDLYHPCNFLPVRPSEAPVGILRRCCSSVHINIFNILRDQHGSRAGPVRGRTAPLRTRKGTDATKVDGWRIWPYGARTDPLRSPHGLFTGCLRSLNPHRARKLYGPRTGRHNSYASHRARAGPVSGRTIFVQNNPRAGREQLLRGPGVWCDWGIKQRFEM